MAGFRLPRKSLSVANIALLFYSAKCFCIYFFIPFWL